MDSSSSQTIFCPIVWDTQNVWVPQGYDVSTLRDNIQRSLTLLNPNMAVGSFRAYGAFLGERIEILRKRCPWIELEEIPRVNMTCSEPHCHQLVAHVSNSLVNGLYKALLDGFSHVLIISSDSDFLSSVRKLNSGEKQRSVMIATEAQGDLYEEVKNSATVVWEWNQLINGGNPSFRRA